MSAYWMGVLTVPAVMGAALFAFVVYVRTLMALERHGFTFEVKWHRDVDGISDYTLRHDIWWERSLGPVFVGHWYYERADSPAVNRWIGVGRANGPCWMAFRKRTVRAAA